MKRILALGILLRIITALFMPAEAFSDDVYHYMLSVGPPTAWANVSFTGLPLYYLLAGPLNLIYPRLFPLLITIIQVILIHHVLKEFSKDKNVVLFGTTFAAIHPLLIRYSSINYQEGLLTCLFLLFIYVFKQKRIFSAGGYMVLIGLTKLTGVLVLPAMGLMLAYSASKEWAKEKWGSYIKMLAVPFFILISFVWVTLTPEKTQHFITQALNLFSLTGAKVWDALLLPWYALGLPPVGFVQDLDMGRIILLIFFIMAATIFSYFYVLAWRGREKSEEKKLIICMGALTLLASAHLGFSPRTLVPLIPLFAIFLMHGFQKTEKKYFAYALLLGFSLFSTALTVGTIMHYSTFHERQAPGMAFLNWFPPGTIYSADNAPAINSNTKHQGIDIEWDAESDYSSWLSKMKKYDFLYRGCRQTEKWNNDFLDAAEQKNDIGRIYADECSTIWRTNP